MAQPSSGQRLPPHFQPRPKAAAATAESSSTQDELRSSKPDRPNGLDPLRAATPTTVQSSRVRSRHRSRSRSPNTGALPPIDASDETTEMLVRRVLCPFAYDELHGPQALHQLLPPLTSSNEADLQLYAILAIVIKEFVYSWYSRITPDQAFVEEIVRIIAHCTRDLEQRLRRLDTTAVVFDEIPALIIDHIAAYRTATDPQRPSALAAEPRAIYHALQPHPAFAPVPGVGEAAARVNQAANEGYYRQLLVHGALAVLLPTEDLQSPPLRILVADILGEMILGRGISQRACEGWLIWEGITKIVISVYDRVAPEAISEKTDPRSQLEQFGLLAKESALQRTHQASKGRKPVAALFWGVLQYGYLACMALRFCVAGLFAATSSAPLDGVAIAAAVDDRPHQSPIASNKEAPSPPGSRSILRYRLLDLASDILDLRRRAPWTFGALAFGRWHLTQPAGLLMGLGAPGGLLDKFLRIQVDEHILVPSRIPSLLRQLRLVLFPNNALAPTRETPSPSEQLAIRRRAAIALFGLVPRPVARRLLRGSADGVAGQRYASSRSGADTSVELGVGAFSEGVEPPSHAESSSISSPHGLTSFATDSAWDAETESMLHEIESLLDVFGDSYMNKHLVFAIVELIFVRLMPELGEKGVRELLEEHNVAV